MSSVINAITHTISISQFNRGLAGKIFEDIKRTGPKVVIKNNIPEVVIMPTDEYIRQQEELEDLRLWKLAMERMENADPKTFVSMELVDKMFGITDEDLQNYDEVEFE